MNSFFIFFCFYSILFTHTFIVDKKVFFDIVPKRGKNFLDGVLEIGHDSNRIFCQFQRLQLGKFVLYVGQDDPKRAQIAYFVVRQVDVLEPLELWYDSARVQLVPAEIYPL